MTFVPYKGNPIKDSGYEIGGYNPDYENSKKEGIKFDKGKPRVGLMFKDFARALLKVAEVGTFGADKYAPSDWIKVPDAEERYEDAKGRHLLQKFIEENDPESDIMHLAHEAWGALATLELKLRELENKDKVEHG